MGLIEERDKDCRMWKSLAEKDKICNAFNIIKCCSGATAATVIV